MPDSRTPAERVAAIHRFGDPSTPAQHAAAAALLEDMLAAAERHGFTLADFDAVLDLPGGALDVVVSRDGARRRAAERAAAEQHHRP